MKLPGLEPNSNIHGSVSDFPRIGLSCCKEWCENIKIIFTFRLIPFDFLYRPFCTRERKSCPKHTKRIIQDNAKTISENKI